MKRIFLLVLLLGTVCSAAAKTQKNSYRVTAQRPACPVVIADIPAWAQSAVVRSGGVEIPSQLDRPLNELVFVADIDGARDFSVVYSSQPAKTVYPARVHAQMWWKNPDKTLRAADTLASDKDDMYSKLHHHGPAFESELAAYRIYFDKKQTIDTYGKKSPQLELATTMWYPSAEQLAAGSGHDNLRVFGSVGVGVLKGWDAQKQKMIHIDAFRRREARIIARGPVRTVVEMRVEGWRYAGREIDMTSRYILYAGHSDVEVENRIEGNLEGLVFTTGVMKMAEHKVRREAASAAIFGRDFPENDTLKWQRESVALAVAVPADQIVGVQDDATSYLFQLRPDARGRIDCTLEMLWRRSTWLDALNDEQCLARALGDVEQAQRKPHVEQIR